MEKVKKGKVFAQAQKLAEEKVLDALLASKCCYQESFRQDLEMVI